MKKVNEKWSLFLIATFTVFFGITNNLLKGTEAKNENQLVDIVMLDLDDTGLKDIVVGDTLIEIKPDIYIYNIQVNELDSLSIIPVLINDNMIYTIDVIGDINVDKSVTAVIDVNVGLENEKKYTLFIEEVEE